jgi:hypothetical protein
MVEPLLTHRNILLWHQNRESTPIPGQRRGFRLRPQPGSCLYVALAVLGVKVA